MPRNRDNPRRALTMTQIEVIARLMQGFTIAQIAELRKTTPRAVRYIAERAKKCVPILRRLI